MGVVRVTLLSLAILVVGFLAGWLVGGLGTGLSVIALLALPVFVIGFLVGWLVEWIIDNQYRRMRELGRSPSVPTQPPSSAAEVSELVGTVREVLAEREQEVEQLRNERIEQESRLTRLQSEYERYRQTHPDDLTAIKGIGRIYQWKLRDAGIGTYEQLALSTAEYIREVLGAKNWQRIDPEDWIRQARTLVRG